MQSKNVLTFVEPFVTTGTEQVRSIETSVDTWRTFLILHNDFLKKYTDYVDHVQVEKVGGTVTVIELSLRLVLDDKTYLHILLFGHSDDGKMLDAGITIASHDTEGMPHAGYMYTVDQDSFEVRRCNFHPVDDDDDEIESLGHFSLIETYQLLEQLEDAMTSDDSEVRMLAQQEIDSVKEDVVLGMTEEDLGYDNQPVSSIEIATLKQLIQSAEPFLIRSSE